MAKAEIDLLGKLVDELLTFTKFKNNEKGIIDVLAYNDMKSLGGDIAKIGDKTVTTLKEKVKDRFCGLKVNAEHKLDIIQNNAGDIIGFRSAYYDKSTGKLCFVSKASNKLYSDTELFQGIRTTKTSEGVNGYNYTNFDKTGAHRLKI